VVSTTAWDVAAATPDPEMPMLTLADLGILRAVEDEQGTTVATITPTYSGCPAMREIGRDIVHRLTSAGYPDVRVRTQLSPAWSSDWITPDGRRKLAAAGIAPPAAAPLRTGPAPLTLIARPTPVACPLCGSPATTRTAGFSGTACKALYRCDACAEPFEYVKEI
jgi:ring-1,2-phenylacetyl-CoA epoxidase subunit PaaD